MVLHTGGGGTSTATRRYPSIDTSHGHMSFVLAGVTVEMVAPLWVAVENKVFMLWYKMECVVCGAHDFYSFPRAHGATTNARKEGT